MKIMKVTNTKWLVEKTGAMRVPIVLFGNSNTIRTLEKEEKDPNAWSSLRQLMNVASLPGVIEPVVAMADVHPGYGFPIGGVAAFDLKEGVCTIAGVGFDCNCGVRMLRTNHEKQEVMAVQEDLANELFRSIPAGVGSKGSITLTHKTIDALLYEGAEYVIKKGYGTREDLNFIEENGRMSHADPSKISSQAKDRQLKQVGTLGSGNHYLEVQYVETIYDTEAAQCFGLFENQVVISIHCGSRALGHQIGTDYLKIMRKAPHKYGITIPDRELVCAPIQSDETRDYYGALQGAVNCAFANRQALAHLTREVFQRKMHSKYQDMGTVYDVGHNNAKFEHHVIDGKGQKVFVHRKGSTRAFGPGHNDIPLEYRKVGQPVLVGGTMGTHSYVLVGTEKAMQESFGSAIHGAGRELSRRAAKKRFRSGTLIDELRNAHIILKGASYAGIAEEAPGAYKDVDEVVDIVHNAGVNRRVAKLRPLICIKG